MKSYYLWYLMFGSSWGKQMDVYDTGPNGYSLWLEDNKLACAVNPSGAIHIYKEGSTGRALYVDDFGRLLIHLDVPTTEVSISFVEEDFSDVYPENREYSLANVPVPGSCSLFRNGNLVRCGSGCDYYWTSTRSFKANFNRRVGSTLVMKYISQ